MRIGIKPGGATFAELAATCAAAESAGFDLISRWDHISGRGFGGLDPVPILGAVAARTSKIRIAFHVLNVSLRNPILLASQLAVLQSVSEGRLEAGLGAGGTTAFIRPDHEMTGTPIPAFAERVRRLETCCQLFPRLWRGEEITEETLGTKSPSFGELEIEPPPIIVGGVSKQILDVGARFADGWNANVAEPEKFAEMSKTIDAARAKLGREGPFDNQVQLLSPMYEPNSLRDLLKRFEDAGAVTAVLGAWEPGVDGVHRLAEAIF